MYIYIYIYIYICIHVYTKMVMSDPRQTEYSNLTDARWA